MLLRLPGRREPASTRIDACHREDDSFADQVRGAYGYTVVGPDGRIGVVEVQSYANGELRGLTVRTGTFRPRCIEIAVEDVEWILPRARMLILGAD